MRRPFNIARQSHSNSANSYRSGPAILWNATSPLTAPKTVKIPLSWALSELLGSGLVAPLFHMEG